jgi:hypothetical protein
MFSRGCCNCGCGLWHNVLLLVISELLWNSRIHLQDYIASKPNRPQSELPTDGASLWLTALCSIFPSSKKEFLTNNGGSWMYEFKPCTSFRHLGIRNISNYYLCHSWAWQKKWGYDIFLHLVNETNTVVALMNESILFRTQSMWKNLDITEMEKSNIRYTSYAQRMFAKLKKSVHWKSQVLFKFKYYTKLYSLTPVYWHSSMKYNSSKLTHLHQVYWSIWTFVYISNV